MHQWDKKLEFLNEVNSPVDVKNLSVPELKKLAEETGIPYQNLINLYLRDCVQSHKKPSIKWAS